MDNFKKSLDELIYAWSKVSEEWNRLNKDEAEFIKKNYPFGIGFQEFLHRLIDWRSEID